MQIQRYSVAMLLCASVIVAAPLVALAGGTAPGAQRNPAETGTLAEGSPSGTSAPDPAPGAEPSATVIDPIVPPVKRVLPVTPKKAAAPPAKDKTAAPTADGNKPATATPGTKAASAAPGKDPAKKKN